MDKKTSDAKQEKRGDLLIIECNDRTSIGLREPFMRYCPLTGLSHQTGDGLKTSHDLT